MLTECSCPDSSGCSDFGVQDGDRKYGKVLPLPQELALEFFHLLLLLL